MTTHAQDGLDNYVFTNSVGLMKNLDQDWSAGGSIDGVWAMGFISVTPTFRCRRWFGREQSVEASLGYAVGNRTRGLVGPIAGVRYSPIPSVFAHAGLCRLRTNDYFYDPQTYFSGWRSRESTEALGGVGVVGAGGVVLWGAELAALGVLLALLAGID